MADHLEALARRLEDDPFFLACPLRLFANSEGLAEEELAARLECSKETLLLLRLCRAPDSDEFSKDVDQIAARFAINRDALIEAIRRGQAMHHMSKYVESDRGILMAARDRDAKKGRKKRPRGGGS